MRPRGAVAAELRAMPGRGIPTTASIRAQGWKKGAKEDGCEGCWWSQLLEWEHLAGVPASGRQAVREELRSDLGLRGVARRQLAARLGSRQQVLARLKEAGLCLVLRCPLLQATHNVVCEGQEWVR